MARYRKLDVLSPKELGEIQGFLAELKDAKLFGERLDELEALKVAINGRIEIYGKAKEMSRLNSEAAVNREESKKILDQALVDRETSKTEIAADKAASRKFITEREGAAQLRIASREKALLDGETDLGAREKVIAKANDSLIAMDLRVAADMALAKEIRTKYTEAVASLTTEIARIQKAL